MVKENQKAPRHKSRVIVKYLALATTKPIRFVQALERLCKEHDESYIFKFDVED